jgi:hypothetical protein
MDSIKLIKEKALDVHMKIVELRDEEIFTADSRFIDLRTIFHDEYDLTSMTS